MTANRQLVRLLFAVSEIDVDMHRSGNLNREVLELNTFFCLFF